ncbi:MAG TPA: putative glycolipid-binding domain-containing protein [Nitrospiraceae bacterium]|nr:putative glycolipid-binding domain-containing protein [Nitrospiraceae bacterium]
MHLSYEVACDESWHARSATVIGWIGRDPVKLAIAAVPGGRWSVNGAEQTRVAGCIDMDLGFTPATNLIQLRRLALGIGDKADAPAAYLRLDKADAPAVWRRSPDFALERLEQQYHRVEPNRYEYQSPSVGYAAPLDVTDIGFVTLYPGLWELEACDV